MKTDLSHVLEHMIEAASDGGQFRIPHKGVTLQVIASWGGGWDHVSVSLKNRPPSWEEMQYVCRLFFDDDETVLQYHPPRHLHRNLHTNCLHLWRPQAAEVALPPLYMV